MRRTAEHKFSAALCHLARAKNPCHRQAFSLLELLVVIAIIVLLLGIFLPVLSNVRKSSRSAICLGNLQQWGHAYQAYMATNDGLPLPLTNTHDPNHLQWFEVLAAGNPGMRAALRCPEADEPRLKNSTQYVKGAGHAGWILKVHEEIVGSYGFNLWVCACSSYKGHPFFHFPVRDPTRVPVLADCCDFKTEASDANPVPTNLENPGPPDVTLQLGEYCIDRHGMAVNVVFLDDHAEHVPLAELWKLKWSEDFVPRDVVVPRPD